MKLKLRAATASIALILAGCGGETTNPAASPAESAANTAEDSDINLAEAEANAEALNTFFEEVFDQSVARSPMTQTYLGIKTDYDKWDDVSPERALEDMEIARTNLAEMQERFGSAPLIAQAKLSYDLFEFQHDVAERAFAYNDHGYTFDQMRGVQSSIPAFMINQHQISDLSDAEAYIARLEGIPAYLGQHIENAKRSAEAGIRPPLFAYDYVLSDAQNIITGAPFPGEGNSPLLDDFSKKIDTLVTRGVIAEEDGDILKIQATEALLSSVGPAYQDLITYIEADKANATTDDGAWKLPDGEAYYAMRLQQMTTTDMSAEEVHNLGLAEVERIHGEMRAIMETVGFEGTLQEFFEDLRTNPKYFYPNTEEGKAAYLADATAMIDTMRDALPAYFDTFPKADLIVKAVEPFREKSAGKAFYQRPAADGSRPGTYYANLYDTNAMPIYQMEALAYHEGIPGHHMQLAIAQELEGIPRFRKYLRATAYTEGWGLYSEWLPKEMGFYEDPYSDFGRLAMELWRAARLVVDTGLHDKKWTRQDAIDYLIENTPNPESDCVKAIERYIVMPGQATAYKIGMNKIIELRAFAQNELGDAYADGWFHDVILADGAMPLAMLEAKVKAAVAERKG